ncbi:MAG: sigma-70 family RNA polymerase sigma factor [Acidobacteriota bacterium]
MRVFEPTEAAGPAAGPGTLRRGGWSELSSKDELRLLRAAAAGDRTAADRLVEATYRPIFATLAKLTGGDPDLAADLTQEAYRKAWASLHTFQGRSRFATWLYRIAYTTYLSHVRRPRRLQALDDDVARTLDDPDPGPEEAAARTGDALRLRRAVLDLPDDLRFTVTARFWRALPVREIARLEGVTGVAIRKRLKKALALLADELTEEVTS